MPRGECDSTVRARSTRRLDLVLTLFMLGSSPKYCLLKSVLGALQYQLLDRSPQVIIRVCPTQHVNDFAFTLRREIQFRKRAYINLCKDLPMRAESCLAIPHAKESICGLRGTRNLATMHESPSTLVRRGPRHVWEQIGCD